MENPVLRRLPLITGILAFTMMIVSGAYALVSLQLTVDGIGTEGTIVDTVRYGLYDHYPIVRFRTEAGAEVEIVASEYHEHSPSYRIDGHLPFAVGDEVPLLYLPDSPGEAKLDRFEELWGWPVLALKIGFGLAVLSGLLAILRARYRKRNMPHWIDPWYFIRGSS